MATGRRQRVELEKAVDRAFGSSREAETYELVLALSTFTSRPRALPGYDRRYVDTDRSDPLAPSRLSTQPRHTPIRREIYE